MPPAPRRPRARAPTRARAASPRASPVGACGALTLCGLRAVQVCAVARDLANGAAGLGADDDACSAALGGFGAPPRAADAVQLSDGVSSRGAGGATRRLGSPRRSAPAGRLWGDAPAGPRTVSRFAFSPPRALRARLPDPTDSETCTASELGELGWRAAGLAGGRRVPGLRPCPGFLRGSLSGLDPPLRAYSFGALGSGAGGDSGLGSDSDGETEGGASAAEGPRELAGGASAAPAWLRRGAAASVRANGAGAAHSAPAAPAAGAAPAAAQSGALGDGAALADDASSCPRSRLGGRPAAAAGAAPAPLPSLPAGADAALDGAVEDGYEESSEDSDDPGGRGVAGRARSALTWLARSSSGGTWRAPAWGSPPQAGAAAPAGPRAQPTAAHAPAATAAPAAADDSDAEGGPGPAPGSAWLQTPSLWRSVRRRLARRRSSQC